MDVIKLAAGDNITTSGEKVFLKNLHNETKLEDEVENQDISDNNITTHNASTIDGNEIKLKQRIAQCKDIIASLKIELNHEKMNLTKEVVNLESIDHVKLSFDYTNEQRIEQSKDVFLPNAYSASVDSKLTCDENLLEYEKQLQKYQNTLNMAQIEKKNAIRKQMLAKAFKLKLLEVENQCNIELLRIKQSLQCLEPLKLVMEKWKRKNTDNIYDNNNFELIPSYRELRTHSGSDISSNSNTDDIDSKIFI